MGEKKRVVSIHGLDMHRRGICKFTRAVQRQSMAISREFTTLGKIGSVSLLSHAGVGERAPFQGL